MGGITKVPSTEPAAARRAILSNRIMLHARGTLGGIEVEGRAAKENLEEGSGGGPTNATSDCGWTARDLEADLRVGKSLSCEKKTLNTAGKRNTLEEPVLYHPLRTLRAVEPVPEIEEKPELFSGKSGESSFREILANSEVTRKLEYRYPVEALNIPELTFILRSKTNFHTFYVDMNYFRARNLIAYVQKGVLEIRRNVFEEQNLKVSLKRIPRLLNVATWGPLQIFLPIQTQ